MHAHRIKLFLVIQGYKFFHVFKWICCSITELTGCATIRTRDRGMSENIAEKEISEWEWVFFLSWNFKCSFSFVGITFGVFLCPCLRGCLKQFNGDDAISNSPIMRLVEARLWKVTLASADVRGGEGLHDESKECLTRRLTFLWLKHKKEALTLMSQRWRFERQPLVRIKTKVWRSKHQRDILHSTAVKYEADKQLMAWPVRWRSPYNNPGVHQ